MTGSILLDVSLATVAFGLWTLLGYVLGRRIRDRLVDAAVADTVQNLIEDEVRAERQAALRLPPTIRLVDAVRFSEREGCTIEEAGAILFGLKIRALVDDHLRAEGHRR